MSTDSTSAAAAVVGFVCIVSADDSTSPITASDQQYRPPTTGHDRAAGAEAKYDAECTAEPAGGVRLPVAGMLLLRRGRGMPSGRAADWQRGGLLIPADSAASVAKPPGAPPPTTTQLD